MKFYHSKLLNSVTNVTHLFTTKVHGNLAFHVHDNPAQVVKNHNALAKELHYDKSSLIHMKQIHSSRVHIVTNEDNFTNPRECDALITNKKNTPLMVMVADCSPILFYDSTKKVIAVAHAGREGAFKNIVQNTLKSMYENFQSQMKDILVSIGPSIKQCCYEVGRELYNEVQKENLDYSITLQEGHYYLDISSILKKQLLTSGILLKHIEIADECTCCNHKTYNSYRGDSSTGRFCGVILLK